MTKTLAVILLIDLTCSAWFEHHPELQPWFNDWPYCRYDSSTGLCIDEFGDEQKCGEPLLTDVK